MASPYRRYRVSPARREGSREFVLTALVECGCTIIATSPPDEAPLRVSFVTPWGETMGIIAYVFTANSKLTHNRPADEHRFQLKYGSKDGERHELWQDPFGLYTTLLLGVNSRAGFFVGADPVLNSPTKFFISKEFKQEQVDQILSRGWHSWERSTRRETGDPIEILVGGTAKRLLEYVVFEREARAEDQGHRHLLAETFARGRGRRPKVAHATRASAQPIPQARLHLMEREFELPASEILELIAKAPRLHMAVRGWVAEHHLLELMSALPIVRKVEPIAGDGQPDLSVRIRGRSKPILVECKNVLRKRHADGKPRLDFMRTRASLTDPCSRYYTRSDFDVVAACLHASTERWEFVARRTLDMAPHAKCEGRLAHRVTIDKEWRRDLADVLAAVAD